MVIPLWEKRSMGKSFKLFPNNYISHLESNRTNTNPWSHAIPQQGKNSSLYKRKKLTRSNLYRVLTRELIPRTPPWRVRTVVQKTESFRAFPPSHINKQIIAVQYSGNKSNLLPVEWKIRDLRSATGGKDRNLHWKFMWDTVKMLASHSWGENCSGMEREGAEKCDNI